MNLLIKNGTLIDPGQNINGKRDLLILKGKVAKIGKKLTAPKGVKSFDAKGLFVSPGFIDIHVHFREPGHEAKETIATGAQAAVAGGFTSVCCMPNTNPINDNKSVTEFIIKEAGKVGLANVFPIASISKQMKSGELSEMATLLKAGAVAFSDDGLPVTSSALMRSALEYSSQFDAPIIDHCEDLDLAGDGVMHEGVVSCCLGLPGKPNLSEALYVARDIMICEEYGGHFHVAHISSKKSVELVRAAKKKGLRVTAEVTPHHFALTDEMVRSTDFDTDTKMNPPLRSKQDLKAVLKGIKDGTIDCIATDHAPHTMEEKMADYLGAPNGIVGLETALALSYDYLVEKGVIDLNRMVAMFTNEPARVMNLAGKGSLKVGMDGDVTVFSTSEVTEVNPDRFKSKGKNTPFKGMSLKGAAMVTIVAGKVVFKRK